MLKQAILLSLVVLTNTAAIASYYQDEANLKEALLSDFTADESRSAAEREEFVTRHAVPDDLLLKVLMGIYRETMGERSILAPDSREKKESKRIIEGVFVWLALYPDARTKPFFLEFAASANEDGFLRTTALSSYIRNADAEEAKTALIRFLVGEEKMDDMTRLVLYQYAQMAWHEADSMEKKAAILAALYVALSAESPAWVFRVGDQIVREMSPRYANAKERLALLERALAHPFPERRERTKRQLESRLEEMRKLTILTTINTNLAVLQGRDFNQPLSEEELADLTIPPPVAPVADEPAQDKPQRPTRTGRYVIGGAAILALAAAVVWVLSRRSHV